MENKRGWAGRGESEGGRARQRRQAGWWPRPGGSARLTWGARGRPGEQQQPEAGEQQPRAAVAGGRPAAAPPRHQRNLGAGLPLHGHASVPRHTGLAAWARSGPGRGRPLRRGLGAAHRAQRGRRGGGGPGRIGGQGPLARRPRRSAPSRASQPLPGNARPRSGRRAPPPGRPGACLRAARRRARRVPGPALPQDPPLRRARGTAPPRTNTAPGRLWKNS